MKFLSILFLLFFSLSLTQCSSTKEATMNNEMKKEMPFNVTGAYFQKWAAGMEAGGSGINIYFPNLTNIHNYKLKQVYFRGMIGVIQTGKASYFASLQLKKPDLILSNEPNAEYGNTLPNNTEAFPFKLNEDECMISYEANGETKYFQVYNIKEKQGEYYPSAPIKSNKE